MPAEGIHLTALREAMIAPELAAPVRGRLIRRDDAARLGALLPDLPYFDSYALEVARYVAGVPARPSRWGAAIHEGGAVAMLGGLLDVARRERDETLSAIALGLASHCAIDRALHPLVNALARLHRGGKNHDASHREVEKFQSICFHEQYLGRDTMGTPAITGNLTIHLAGLLADQLEDRLGVQLREAWALALGAAPTHSEHARVARGESHQTPHLGASLGNRVPSPAAEEA
ncbi:MAG: zinc dependent phospholipase C family protein, partial [Kofleriaceae bacterium]